MATSDSRFRLSEDQAVALADAFGTPLYVIDETHFRSRVRRYLGAFRAAWPACEVSFASKSNSTLAVLAIAYQEGCSIDVASEGELRAAMAAGVPASRCHLHGSNKSPDEIRFALAAGIGQVVIDNFGEIGLLSSLGCRSKCVMRLAPEVDPVTHAKISTGQADTKFGFNVADGSAEQGMLRCLEVGLPLIGFHCHVGSQLLDPGAQQSGGEIIARFAVEMKWRHGFEASLLNVGGGLGVRYLDEQQPMEVEEYCKLICGSVAEALEGSGLNPVLGQEPGRSLIAESGVTLYRVGPIKRAPSPSRGFRTYVSVDGGLADNPRPALYGARYTVERVAQISGLGSRISDLGSRTSLATADARQQKNDESSESAGWAPSEVPDLDPEIGFLSPKSEIRDPSFGIVTVAGRHCETDTLFEDVALPMDLATGDLLQVLCTGAYNSSMASNYNRYPRPATALIREDGSHCLIQRRDSWEEMLAREILPSGLGGN